MRTLTIIALAVLTMANAHSRTVKESFSPKAEDIARLAKFFDSNIPVRTGRMPNAPWGRSRLWFQGDMTVVLKGAIGGATIYLEDQNGNRTHLRKLKAYRVVKRNKGPYPSLRFTIRNGKAELSLGQKEQRFGGTVNSTQPYRMVLIWSGRKWTNFRLDAKTPKKSSGKAQTTKNADNEKAAKSKKVSKTNKYVGKWRGPSNYFLFINADGTAGATWGYLPERRWFPGSSGEFYVTKKSGEPGVWNVSKSGKVAKHEGQLWTKVE